MRNNTALADVVHLFYNCANVYVFTLYFGSSNINQCDDMFYVTNSGRREVYAPLNSTSYKTFQDQASQMSLTVRGF